MAVSTGQAENPICVDAYFVSQQNFLLLHNRNLDHMTARVKLLIFY